MANFIQIKNIQKSALILAFLSFLASFFLLFSNFPNLEKTVASSIFLKLFFSISEEILNIPGMDWLLGIQLSGLGLFFLLATYIGIKILPEKLSDNDIKKSISSPFSAFNKLIFSKTLLGRVLNTQHSTIDTRNFEPRLVADVYLMHFIISGKKNFLAFLFLFTFVFPLFLEFSNRSGAFQLLVNFIFTNMAFFFIYDLILLMFSKFITRGNRDS